MIPLSVAAGWVKRPHDINRLITLDPSILGSVTLGSYTLEPRDGNAGTTFSSPLNALGLPNPGIKVACDFLPGIGKRLVDCGMRMRVSIAGFSPKEYADMVERLSTIRWIDTIELNFGCPNVRVDSKQKPIMAFDPSSIAATLELIYEATKRLEVPALDAKLSPYSDPMQLTRVAEAVSRMRGSYFAIRNVVVCNTFPNAYGFNEDGDPLLTANDGYGGLSGQAMRLIALGNARQFRVQLPKTIGVIACGGIDSGIAVRDAELVGANEAQIGLAYFESEDPAVFQRIVQEYVDLG